MVEFVRLLDDAWRRIREFKPLMMVPVIVSFFSIDNIKTVLDFHGFHIGIKFLFPEAVPNLWSFVSLPSPKSGISFSSTGLILLAVFTIVESYLASGYLGSIRDCIRGRTYNFFENAWKYFIEMLKFRILLLLIVFTIMYFVLVAPILTVFVLPLFLILMYFIYGVPYLIIFREIPFEEALKKNLDLALNLREYMEFGLKYLLFVLLISVFMTFLTVNLNIIGIFIGLLIMAPIALTLTIATMLFFPRSCEILRYCWHLRLTLYCLN